MKIRVRAKLSVVSVVSVQNKKTLNFQHNEEVHQTNPVDPFDRPGDRLNGDADRMQRHTDGDNDIEQRQTR